MEKACAEREKNYLASYDSILSEMIREMTSVETGCSVSRDFILQMIPHHQAAVSMSAELLKYSGLKPLRCIAENIITTQENGICEMKAALDGCSCCKNSGQEVCQYQRRFRDISRIMFAQMKCAPRDSGVNVDFIQEMIPHHRGAILMSENALQYPICPQLKPILDNIIRTQTQGIEKMQEILRQQTECC